MVRNKFIYLLILLSTVTVVCKATETSNRTIIGPSNIPMSEGVLAMHAGDYAEAARLFANGMRLTSSDKEVVAGLSNLCAAYVMLGKNKEAISYCDLAIEKDNKFWRAYNNRALANIHEEQFEAAAKDIATGLEINPDASSLRKTQLRYDNAINPVIGTITIDDREISDIP